MSLPDAAAVSWSTEGPHRETGKRTGRQSPLWHISATGVALLGGGIGGTEWCLCIVGFEAARNEALALPAGAERREGRRVHEKRIQLKELWGCGSRVMINGYIIATVPRRQRACASLTPRL